MVKKNSWKKADYPNRRPFYANQTLYRSYNKVSGFVDNKKQAEGMARGLKVFGNKTKIVKSPNGYAVYYKKK